ncbi:hypothetical protein IAD21_05027 [Abditibacteriota bacterium]|nr:hypothetical protein IAD21_05027 [Abditibacteriota bacterium]
MKFGSYHLLTGVLLALGTALQTSNAKAVDRVVTSTAEGGSGTLENALLEAQSGDRVTFNIPGSGQHVLSMPLYGHLLNRSNVTVDATTQPGYVAGGPPVILLPGRADYESALFRINGSNNTVRGLNLYRFSHGGLSIGDNYNNNNDGNHIENCVIGFRPGSTDPQDRGKEYGVNFMYGKNNILGGSLGARNFIAGIQANTTGTFYNYTGTGVVIDIGVSFNKITGNTIGLDMAGNALANRWGVFVSEDADSNTIGEVGVGNIISGNTSDGVYITRFQEGSGNGDSGRINVYGNYIGLDPSGTQARPNGGHGVNIRWRSLNGLLANTIAGNALSGVHIETSPTQYTTAYSNNNTITRNVIGLNVQGVAVPNGGNGIELVGRCDSNLIGGNFAESRNIISGNAGRGISVAGSPTKTYIGANYIGLDPSGTLARPNSAGILLNSAVEDGRTVFPTDTTIQLATVSGNGAGGVRVLAGTNTILKDSRIGTNAAGTAAIGNGGTGVEVRLNPNYDTSLTMTGNLVSGNGLAGVTVFPQSNTTSAEYPSLVMQSNIIGLNLGATAAIPNAGDGVLIQGGAGTTALKTTQIIGGAGKGNIIAGNGRHGVYLAGPTNTNDRNVSTLQGNFIGTNGTARIPNGGSGVVCELPNQLIGTPNVGNIISGNAQNGVVISNSGIKVQGNFIGTSADGNGGVANGLNGVVTTVSDALIGGANTASEFMGNVISGNGNAGVLVQGALANTKIIGNRIGTNVAVSARVPNGFGIIAMGNGNGQNAPTNVQIGGVGAGEQNVIAGNANSGVRLLAGYGHVVKGNLIGISAANVALANGGNGIETYSTNTLIGGRTAPERNIISGNGGSGIYLFRRGVTINGNYIGTNAAGTAAVGNGTGVTIATSDANVSNHVVLGGLTGQDRNLISGNVGDGVVLLGAGFTDVKSNYIGTTLDGKAALPNGGSGVVISAPNCVIGASTSTPGVEPANIISGNKGRGVYVFQGTNTVAPGAFTIIGNRIGLGSDGAALGNAFVGILVADGSGNIGGTNSGERNVISSNKDSGIRVFNAGATNIVGNFIGTALNGTEARGNGGHGIALRNDTAGDASDAGSTVGGVYSGSPNTIAFNAKDGVNVSGPATALDRNSAHAIVGNHIMDNGGLGINLQPDGEADKTPTLNDTDDPDAGPNGLQNFPIIRSIAINANGTGTLSATLNVAKLPVNTTYNIQLFSNATDASGFGEGPVLADAAQITIPANQTSTFLSFPTSNNPADRYSLTVTRMNGGGTSEFSPSRSPGYGPPVVSVSSVSSTEGNAGTKNFSFVVKLSRTPNAGENVTLNYAATSGTATVGIDFNAIPSGASLTFAPGETQKTVIVQVKGDTAVEANETFYLTLSNLQNVTLDPTNGRGTGTIINDDSSSNVRPTNGTVAPNAAADAPNTARLFTATYSDGNGAADIQLAYLSVGANTRYGLRVAYNALQNKLYILNDAGTSYVGGVVPGTGSVLSNSQGSLNCAATTVSSAGNTLTIKWSLSAKATLSNSPNFTGNRGYPLLLSAVDKAGLFSNFEGRGYWTISGNSAPRNVSLQPGGAVSNSVGQDRLFRATYSDPQGWQNLRFAYLQVKTGTAHTLRCIYDVQNNLLSILNDAGNGQVGGIAPGTNQLLSNSQGSLNVQSSRVRVLNATTLQIDWVVRAGNGLVGGSHPVLLLVQDAGGLSDGFDSLATWNIASSGASPRSFREGDEIPFDEESSTRFANPDNDDLPAPTLPEDEPTDVSGE